MQKIRAIVAAVGTYNLILIVCVASFVAFVLSFHNGLSTIVQILCGAVCAGAYYLLDKQRRAIEQIGRDRIDVKWQDMVKAIKDTHLYALSKLSTCPDHDLVEQVMDKLMEAASHMGSNPDWRNTRRIVTDADVQDWYGQGIVSAAEARALVDGYVAKNPYAGGLGDAHH